MPYKDPERKRQWEREHREQRNKQRQDRLPSVMRPDSNTMVRTTAPKQDNSVNAKANMFMNLLTGFICLAFLLFAVRQVGARKMNKPSKP